MDQSVPQIATVSAYQEAPLYQELHSHESVCVIHPESHGRHLEGNHIIHHVFQATQGRPRVELLLKLCGIKSTALLFIYKHILQL